jgi:WD40 repeat protein
MRCKTTLAIALCHDEDVQTAFDDGILWATLGENPNILNKLTVLYRALTGESTNFIEIEEGATKLAEKLADLDVLLVIDDVWNPAHLRPFLRGGERVARLVTTRFSNIAVEANAEFLEVDEMTTAESIQMLLAGIEPPGDLTPFQKLAERLGEWALMLEVTNGMIRKRMKVQSASLENALAFVNTALDKRGIGGLKTGSNEAAVQVLDTSIAQVDKSDQLRLFELAVFVEDTDIPLTSVMTLWEMDDFDTQELISQFDDLSFVRFNANRGIIRLHDVVREVLLTQLNNPTAIHAKLVENYGLSSLHSNVSQLPDAYAWRNIAYHLVQSQQKHVLHNLLCEPTYIQNKLNATNDPNTLIDDFEIYALNNDGSDDTLLFVKSALSISSHILSKYPTQCLTQLYGRLQNQMTKSPSISRLLETIQKHEIQPALLTGQPSLQQAGELLRRTLAGHLRSVRSVRFIGDNSEVISASGDKTLRLWNIAQGKFFRIFHGHEYSVSSVSVAPNKKIIASASWDYTVKLWDIETGQEIRTCIGHKDRVNAVLFSPNGQYIISASNDHTIKMWDVSTGQEIRTFLGHRGRVYDIAITADARKLASASSGHTIRLWDVGSGEQLHTLVGHTDRVNAVDFSPDGHSIISASNDGTLKLWNINTGYEIRTYSGHTGRVYDVLFFNSGNFFASASRDRTIRIWDKDMSDAKHIFWGHTGPVNSIAMTSDDMLLVSASNDKTLKVWELENISSQNSSDSISVTTGHSSSVTAVKFNRHGSELISASIDGTLKLWDAITGKEIRTLARHTDRITAIELSPDGSTAISASWDKPPIVWETSSWKQLLMFSGHTGPVNQVAYAPNGETVASASTDTSVEIWDVSSGQRIRTLIDHTGEVNTVTFTPDGNYVISGAGSFGIQKDNTLKLWNIHTGDLVRTFRGHTGDVMSATVSTDGGTILSSSADLTLKLWDLQSGQLIQDLADTPQNRANLYKQHSISLNPILSDLRLIIIPNQDGDLEIWQDDKRLYVFTANGAVQNQACAVSTSLKLVAGDISGKIHFLQPNNALEKIMRGINLAVD